MRIICFLFLWIAFPAMAQRDTSVMLKTVDIQSHRFSFTASSMQTEQLDTSTIYQLSAATLADRLNRESSLFVKSYGAGSLATISLRGTGAAHTAVLWNGLSLNSPMLGLYDFSLLPMFLLDDVSVQSGGNGPLVGSGGVGGAIVMNANIDFRKRMFVKLFSTYGSFGQWQQGAAVEGATGKLISKTRFYQQQADNDFYFKNPEGAEKKQQQAAVKQYGLTQDLSYGTPGNHVDVHGWYLKNEREIPALMIAQSSAQEQSDHSLRLAMNWSVLKERWFWNLRGGFNKEEIRYIDPVARLNEFSRAMHGQSEGEIGYVITPFIKIMTQVAFFDSRAETPHYTTTSDQQQISMGTKLMYERKHLYINAALRQSYVDGKAIPLLPAISMSYQLHSSLQWRADVSRVYRVPTLNDRFWVPGGKVDLKPEKGFSSSTGLAWNQEVAKIVCGANAGVFYSELDQAIVWVPGTNGIYGAQNIHALRSKGFEGGWNAAYQLKSWKFQVCLRTNVVSSVITSSDASFSDAIGKQLMYTPELQYRSEAHVSFKQFHLQYFHNYTGYRYTTLDHSYFLEPFSLSEVQLAWNIKWKSAKGAISAGIKNLYNEEYQTIAWRAMPGRSFHTGLLITFGN